MNKSIQTVLLTLVLTMLTGCAHKDTKPFALDADADIIPAPIQRLDLGIENYITLDSAARVDFMAANKDVLTGFGLFVDGSDRVDNTSLSLWSTWPATVMFMPQVKSVFPDLKAQEAAFGRILATAEANDLDLPADRFVAVTWGDPRSIMIMDTISTAYIALNHYLGPLNEAYNGWPEYRRSLKTPNMIPVDMAEALVSTAMPYDAEGSEATVLSRLLYEGALSVAKQAMVPTASTAEVLGFLPATYAKVVENEAFMWKQLVADNKLYSTDADIISNLFDLRPSSSLISPDAPGRAVRYIGYRIVSDYLDKHPETTLAQILAPDFYTNGTAILKDTAYSPR